MSWLFSQALVAAYSAENSLDGEQFALSNTNPMPQAFLPQGKMTGFSKRSLSGMTFGLLTENLGGALLTWFRAAFPARTSASQGGAQELTANDPDSGEKWQGSFTRYDPATLSWKTHQHLLAGGLEEFSEAWPRWGLMQGGECWALDTSGLGICGNESGWWLPTCGKNEFKGAGKQRYRGSVEFRGAKMSEGLRTCMDDPIYLTPCFAEYAMGWPIMWTGLAQLAMDKFQQWQHSHGLF